RTAEPRPIQEARGRERALRAARALSRDPCRDRAARRGAVRGGLRCAVDARREPHQVAPRPYELVLRDVRAGAGSRRLPPVPAGVSRHVQLVLQPRRRPASPTRSRPTDEAPSRGDPRLPRARGSTDGTGPCGRRRRSAGDPERDRAGASARTAAPGADPHGPQTPVRPEPPETRLLVGASPRGRRRDETASAPRGPQAWARLDAGAGAGGEASSDGGLEPWGKAEN